METTHTNRKNVIIRYACLVLFIILMGIDIFWENRCLAEYLNCLFAHHVLLFLA